MATLTLRNLDEGLKSKLRIRAAENGRSMEAELREILRVALAGQVTERGLGSRIASRFATLPDQSLPVPPRTELARPAELPD